MSISNTTISRFLYALTDSYVVCLLNGNESKIAETRKTSTVNTHPVNITYVCLFIANSFWVEFLKLYTHNYTMSTIRSRSSVRPAKVLFSKCAVIVITLPCASGRAKLSRVLKNAIAFTIFLFDDRNNNSK